MNEIGWTNEESSTYSFLLYSCALVQKVNDLGIYFEFHCRQKGREILKIGNSDPKEKGNSVDYTGCRGL